MSWTVLENDDYRAVCYHTHIINHAQTVLKVFPNHHERKILEDRIKQFKDLLPPKDHPVWESEHKRYFWPID